jgi:hypothetical protein
MFSQLMKGIVHCHLSSNLMLWKLTQSLSSGGGGGEFSIQMDMLVESTYIFGGMTGREIVSNEQAAFSSLST